ncbi:MAG: transcription-repair coupling factor [Prevotella sp.]|nr:transcription-repair coupling factor [Prevotella sp.]
MNIHTFQQTYRALPQCKTLIKTLEDKSIRTVFLQGLMASAPPLLFASLVKELHFPVLFILQDSDEAGYFYQDLTQLLDKEHVLYYPSSYRRALKYGQRDAANEILRTEVLACLNQNDEMSSADSESVNSPLYIVTCPEALCELVVSKQHLEDYTLSLEVGLQVDIMECVHRLRTLGFMETDYVYEPGQFAVRGSIIDVFSFSCEHPFRIDFFGDEIDTIRTFEVQNQLSLGKKMHVKIVPEPTKMQSDKVSFLHFLPQETILVFKDYRYVKETISRIYHDGFSSQALTERMEGMTEVEQRQLIEDMRRERNLIGGTQFAADAEMFRRIEIGHQPMGTPQAILTFDMVAQPLFHKNFSLLRQTLEDYLSKGYRLVVLAESLKQISRLKEILNSDTNHAGNELEKSCREIIFDSVICSDEAGQQRGLSLHEGFIDHNLCTCFFTDHQIFDRFHKYNLRSDVARAGKIALTMKELQEMEPGDFLVHVDFGIGKFGGLVRVPVHSVGMERKGGYQEVIRLIYQRGDIVDVSIHSLYKISKYKSGTSGEQPRLSTLGTGAWERMKEKTKKRIKDIARDLIKLYAKRRHESGFAFSPDNSMQHELEASFLYEDTPDQLKATMDIKTDMERPQPMDRLVCGDVGFGKTEVAVRAAFKATCDSKQVAVLVPTTVLAFQHYQTFKERLRNLPVRVDYLSRARTTKQTKQVLTDLQTGNIDILVGTHKLIGKSVVWKDLGLLIIDEEQKFGVAVKEKLRKLKTNVDTLTMSATPIPRTLQFSLMGARDMSIIRTPPPNRHPIQTELATFNHEVIAEAINFEMSRNGQVFFVNDRISSLTEIANLIQRHVPDCRVAVAHGRMKPEELEEIVMKFIQHDYDLLLSTTIIENGIDISNANTIIINDAHRFGLSDLHQMRGRVGRSNRKAFCYLLAPPKSMLTPEARRRLEALETFSELGSGFNLAMQDLDIRGAGNLLGAEQSGFMEELGYETYLKIIRQAMAELRNETPSDDWQEMAGGSLKEEWGDSFVDDCSIESDLEMYFPDNYIPGSSERMLLYRELDSLSSDEELKAYKRRLEDRFGKMPQEGEELMQVVALRRIGKRLGCEKIILKQGKMQLQLVENKESIYYKSVAFERLINFVTNHPRQCNLKEERGKRWMIMSNMPTVGKAVESLRSIESVQSVG